MIKPNAYILMATALCMATLSTQSNAWRSYGGSGSATGRYGGSASWSDGSGSATGARGGTASWSDGSGSATGARGGTANWSDGSGSAQGAYGGSAAWSNGSGYAHGAYGGSAAWSHPPAYGYHPPVYYGGSYNSGYSGGDVAAAGIAGLAVGAMVGAAAASQSAPPPTVVAQQPQSGSLPLGTTLSYLPSGCTNLNINSSTYYQCGMNWFKPYFGSNGAYYQVVPAP
ncbi:MAG: hypothetical protein NTV43_12135 [Methylococcales bacterium]|nr:hypothetical protein [Methylococcales bacterium]